MKRWVNSCPEWVKPLPIVFVSTEYLSSLFRRKVRRGIVRAAASSPLYFPSHHGLAQDLYLVSLHWFNPPLDDIWLESGPWLSRLLAATPTFNDVYPCSLAVRFDTGERKSLSGETTQWWGRQVCCYWSWCQKSWTLNGTRMWVKQVWGSLTK